ncbi:MAG: LLM class flavin-dependent oxidoreductase [Acidimicrobiia bacterium]|nr:LLM class flavin-dependent oxidoreductase [Acidimicrobiia bacterium]
MQLSMWIHNRSDWDEIADLARLADDDLNWTSIWFADHYMPDSEDGEPLPGDTHEAWSILAGLAAVTRRIRLGPLVSPTSVHHPALLANRAATIDHLSSGRFVLGLGAGWQVNEHNAYGIHLEAPKVRVDRFEEAIQVVRSLLDNERTDFNGTYFQFTDAPCEPHPVQDRLPILVGTNGSRMLRITARWAQEWNTWGAPELAASQRARFAKACEQVGTDPGTKRTSAQALVFMSDDEETLARRREKVDLARAVVGTPAQLVEELGAYADAGFDEFIVLGATLGKSVAERRESYERFSSEVAAAL